MDKAELMQVLCAGLVELGVLPKPEEAASEDDKAGDASGAELKAAEVA